MHRVVKSAKQPYAFKIIFIDSSEESNVTLDALNLETLQRWMFSLTWCVARAKGKSPPSSPRSSVTQAELDPMSPKSSPPIQVLNVRGVQRALAQCDRSDIPDIEACVEAMTSWLQVQRGTSRSARSQDREEQDLDLDF